jgi:uncharacterized membrane protein
MNADMEYFRHIMEVVGTSVDGVGVFIVAAGMVAATVRLVSRLRDRAHGTGNYYSLYRQDVGRAILLGLEFLMRAISFGPLLSRRPCKMWSFWE